MAAGTTTSKGSVVQEAWSACKGSAMGRRAISGQVQTRPWGRFLYSTYTEKDYNVIWDNYMYISQDNWWVEYDFGKKNCSEAGPRRADVPGRLEDVWVERVGDQKAPFRNVLS